jgi:hypothetical protein
MQKNITKTAFSAFRVNPLVFHYFKNVGLADHLIVFGKGKIFFKLKLIIKRLRCATFASVYWKTPRKGV